MTGTLLLDPPRAPAAHARALRARRRQPSSLFADPRRFGTGELALGADAHDAFFAARLGVEPLGPEFTASTCARWRASSRAPIKAFLLDQKRIAGVGNIYADEALFRAQHPPAAARATGSTRKQCARAARRGRRVARGRHRRPRAPRSTTSATPTASAAASRTGSSSTCARASRARAAARTVRKLRAAGRGHLRLRALPAAPAARRAATPPRRATPGGRRGRPATSS